MNTTVFLLLIALIVVTIIIYVRRTPPPPQGIIISDTSALLHLSAIGYLELLHILYGEVWITREIYREIYDVPGKRPVPQVSWLKVGRVRNRAKIAQLLTQYQGLPKPLDIGEASGIALALETNAKLVIIDERTGRKAASDYGLAIVGVIGILKEAKDKGILQDMKPVLDALTLSGFYISDKLRRTTLNDVGEQP